jgi:hypothetical protein
MSPAGVMSEHEKKVRFRKFIQKRRIKGEPIPKSYLGDENDDDSKTKYDQEHFKSHCRQGKFFTKLQLLEVSGLYLRIGRNHFTTNLIDGIVHK